MTELVLKSERRNPPRQFSAPTRLPTALRVFLILVLAGLAGVFIEHLRGEWSLRRWEQEMSAHGEVFEVKAMYPAPSPLADEFRIRLNWTLAQLPQSLSTYAGQMSGMVPDRPGECRRGSQEPLPPMNPRSDGPKAAWSDLNEAVRQSQPGLSRLRSLMKECPREVTCAQVSGLASNSIPNLVNERRGAQALQAAILQELHEGNLQQTVEDFSALQGFIKLHADDPSLVRFMVRVAILGMSVDLAWDALQARGWTEPQLATLQQQWESSTLLKDLPRALEAERATRLKELEWFRSHSYDEWLSRYQPMYEALGLTPPIPQELSPERLWQQWGFHPVWSYSWSALEELTYLQAIQHPIEGLRQVAAGGSWRQFTQDPKACQFDPPARLGAWRFYVRLPLAETGSPGRGYPDFSMAWSTALKNLTLQQMLVAAVALKRYELRHGRLPASLAALSPELLKNTPRDLMDGQPLRYQARADGSFTLYSVGEDLRDNGGDPLPGAGKTSSQSAQNWQGQDWVWPKAVVGTRVAQSSVRRGP